MTDTPGADGFGLDESDADVAAARTVWFALMELPVEAKFGEPS